MEHKIMTTALKEIKQRILLMRQTRTWKKQFMVLKDISFFSLQ